MKIFVTGATGFIGRDFLDRLLTRLDPESTVYVSTRSPYRHEDPRVHPVTGDLTGIADFQDILLECDYVYHLAACATFGNDLPYEELNFQPTKVLVDVLKESRKIKNFVFISTIGALDRAKTDLCDRPLTVESEPSPTSRYGQSKLKAEHFIGAQNKVPYTILRASWVYGKHMRTNSHLNVFVDIVRRKSILQWFRFPGRVPLIHVSDLSRALVNCLGNEKILGKTYIAVTENVAIGDLFREISEAIKNKRVMQIPIPSLQPVFARIHARLPLTVSNLFLDYLCAEDDRFAADFRISNPVLFAQGKKELIDGHISSSGFWVITGANSGIGFAVAEMLGRSGKKMILVDKEVDRLQEKFGSASDDCLVLQSDLADKKEIFSLATKIGRHRIYVLINNAGAGQKGSIAEVPYDKIEKIIDVNVKAPMFLTKALLSNLTRNESMIVNVSSSIALNPLPGMGFYSASKAALGNWSESLSYELRKTNKVITLYPSGTRTNFQKNSGVKVLRNGRGLLPPETVAAKIIRAVERRRPVEILSPGARSLLLISKFIPRKMNTRMWGGLFDRLR